MDLQNPVELKDSGIDWIGKIPQDWSTRRFKTIIVDSVAGEVIDKSYWNDGNELLYTCQRTPMMSCFSKFPFRKRTFGNCLLLTRNATPYVFIPEDNSIFSNVVQKVRLSNSYDKRYISYAIQLGVNEETVNGDTIPSYNMDVWNNIHFCDVSLSEQQAIADYLDAKCSEIDSLHADIEKQIGLLEQYKKSLIYEAVTKGLDSNVEMKDSGIDWIGKVSKSWQVCKQKYFIKLINGRAFKDIEFENNGKYLVLRVGNLFTNPVWYTSSLELDSDKYCNNGDLIYAWSMSYAPFIWNGCKVIYHYHIWKTVLDYHLLKKFAYYYLIAVTDALQSEVHETTMGFITMGIMNNSYIVCPDMQEQQKIVDYLDNKCAEIDSTIAGKKKQLEKLEAYKKSLIYEYVTGKKRVPLS